MQDMITKEIMKEIKELAIRIDHDAAFGGKSKGNRHLVRAVRIAKHLAKQEKANINIVEAGAWLHDTALPTGNDYDYAVNKKIVMKLLSKTKISKPDSEMVAECVASHEGTEIPRTTEAKIVHDADVLEKTGILGVIRHTWKLTNQGKINPEHISKEDITEVIKHIRWRTTILQTPSARKLAKENNALISGLKLKKIIPIISKLAKDAIITEKIAVKIRPLLNTLQSNALKKQLTLEYLS